MGKDEKSLPQRKSLRMKTLDYSDPYIYSITICTAEKKRIFANPNNAKLAKQNISEFANRYEMEIYAYCVMPDHIHIVVQPQSTFSISSM